jgi:hypothetical protein
MTQAAAETAPARCAPHPSVRMRKLTARQAKRRERWRRKLHAEHTAYLTGPGRSDRSRFKERMRETYVDQVTLDKLNGLELGHFARAAYRETRRTPDPPQAKHRGKPRPREAYRWARKKEERGPRMSLVLKRLRIEHGLSRSEADRLRWQEARANGGGAR